MPNLKSLGFLARLARMAVIVAGTVSTFAAGHNWQAACNGGLQLSRFNLPGTHDSGALYEPLSGTAKCQNLTIAEQLNAGVRFLDIRCRHVNDAFAIHHGSVYQNQNFDDVLNAVIGFLTANPTECVIMSVKEEYDPAGNTRSFESTFDAYVAQNPSKWLLGSGIPTLDAARGKIVLLCRFSASSSPKGINATSWADNTTFTSGSLRVQDYYNVSDTAVKWTAVTNLFNDALSGADGTLHLNFTSGYTSGLFGIPSIPTVANYINPRLTTFFNANRSGRYGVVVMDFADAARCSLIYTVQDLSISVASSLNPSVSGQWVTLTANLVGTVLPTGTVTFKSGVVTLGTAAVVGGGSASLVVTNLNVGVHSITAVYSGDSHFVGTFVSPVLTQTVNGGGPNFWTGNSSSVWDINGAINWRRDAVAGKFQQGDFVVFDDASPNSTLQLNVTVNPAGILFSNHFRTYNLAGSGTVAGMGGLTKRGGGIVILNCTNNYAGPTVVNGGTLIYGGSGSSVGGGTLSVLGSGTNAALQIVSPKTISFGGGTALGAEGGAGCGLLTMQAGTLNLGTSGDYLEIGAGGTGAHGALNLVGGTLNTMGNSGVRVGAQGRGVYRQTGGVMNCSRWFAVGTISGQGTNGGQGVATFLGGTANIAPAFRFILGDKPGATGVMNLGTAAGGSAVVKSHSSGGAVVFLNDSAASAAVLNLNQGTLQLGGPMFRNPINTEGVARLNLNGGTLQAVSNQISLISPGALISTLFKGGIVVDTLGNHATLSVPLAAASGDGLYPAGGMFTLGDGGSGYLAPPLVTLSGGSGSNATAIAELSGGTVGSVVITCPGEGYAIGDNITVSFQGGGASVPAPSLQRVLTEGDLASNTQGGIVKLGNGTLAITSTNVCAGTIVVSNGTLQLLGPLPGGGDVSVFGTLELGAEIAGTVTVENGGVLKPASESPGTNAIGGDLILLPGAEYRVRVDANAKVADRINASGAVTLGGKLVLTALSGSLDVGDSFQLFSASGYSGAFGEIEPVEPGPGLAWDTSNLAFDGTLKVREAVSLTPPELVVSQTDAGGLVLAWPESHIGWSLLVQTNDLSTGLGTNWTRWIGAAATNSIVIPIGWTNPAVFFRLVYP